jgi:hypothetical protein
MSYRVGIFGFLGYGPSPWTFNVTECPSPLNALKYTHTIIAVSDRVQMDTRA